MIRNPIPWPNGARCAVAVTFDMDADSLIHIAQPERSHKFVSTTSMLRYGPEIGVPRILDTYKKLDVKQTFFVPGWCAENHPEAVESMIQAGHEVALHSYIHESSYDFPRDEEYYWLCRSRAALEAVTGTTVKGWRAPMYSFSEHTASMLVQEGFQYDASLMGDDQPYLIETEAGQLVELPSHWGMDDYPQYAHTPELHYSVPVKSPLSAIENYRAEFDAHYEHGGLWVPVWHPFLTGRLARWHAIEKFLLEIREKDVWFATLEEIATYVEGCVKDGSFKPRVHRLPYRAAPLSLMKREDSQTSNP